MNNEKYLGVKQNCFWELRNKKYVVVCDMNIMYKYFKESWV